eukprot:TRINITY_DN30657_c0_g1_i1.p1 TRINITY_DN30657_c0_g1~~TRINITY_DN30657_c0_g1_i1.p1  ORF type:complete len:439 (-),score=95.34 TRINITY_DN30657_c0_g1_i1:152-1468(-)
MAALRHGVVWAAAAAVVLADSPKTYCTGLLGMQSFGQVQMCLEELMGEDVATQEEHRGPLKKVGMSLQEIRQACDSTEQQLTILGCRAVSELAHAVAAEVLAMLRFCQVSTQAECDDLGQQAALSIITACGSKEEEHRNLPSQGMVSERLAELRKELLLPMAMQPLLDGEAMPNAWTTGLRFIEKLKYWLSGYIWRETHWLWLQDSLAARKVVHTTWGPAEEWRDRFGANDCHAEAPLTGTPPRYLFSERTGVRWEIVVALLRELRDRRKEAGTYPGLLSVAEIGVFAGHLSHIMLRDCDFVTLLGVDPYIGSDGTFPGNFSETLDADLAFYKAVQGMLPYEERASLLKETSEDAAKQIPDGSLDVVFIDGCHLYDCVKTDFDVWLPKLRRGVEVLVAGHDFSPQWPGVVRAVHEQRSGGREVNLASDWLFWWFTQYD